MATLSLLSILALLLHVALAFRLVPVPSRLHLARRAATLMSVEPLVKELGVDLAAKVKALGFDHSEDLIKFGSDFESRPEALSTVFIQDFGLMALDAHRLRAAIMQLLGERSRPSAATSLPAPATEALAGEALVAAAPRKGMKKAILNSGQALRRQRADLMSSSSSSAAASPYDYGLTSSNTPLHVADQLEGFYTYMTELSPTSQEAPIRAATATVYVRHAKLFLGWHLARLRAREIDTGDESGIRSAFPTKDREGAREAFDFVKWLRAERRISTSYESNVIRGLTKLAKFRFSKESLADPEYGGKTFDDIPVIRELRKIHRLSEGRRKLSSTRVSDEKKKWLSWPEYLGVVDACWAEVQACKERLSAEAAGGGSKAERSKRLVAIAFQQYLVLAFFSIVPDRQRTIRELEIGRTFMREEGQAQGEGGAWSIVHTSNDYKTGKSYGDRPPLPISAALTGPVDEFIAEWRPCLEPQGMHLFAQTKLGGKALTQDSVYQIVSRACYRHTGKRTNPHLLRDMVVTYVRSETDASEKDLEALALFMGHSLSMQKQSYDRRTLNQKVAPAVALVQGLGKRKP